MTAIFRPLCCLFFLLLVTGCHHSGITWTAAEKDNARYVFRSMNETGEAAELANRLPSSWRPGDPRVTAVLEKLRAAYNDAAQVTDAVLIKAHPGMPRHWQDYMSALRRMIGYYKTGQLPKDGNPADELRTYSSWFIRNQYQFRWADDQPERFVNDE